MPQLPLVHSKLMLRQLGRLPLDQLKIDQFFAPNLGLGVIVKPCWANR